MNSNCSRFIDQMTPDFKLLLTTCLLWLFLGPTPGMATEEKLRRLELQDDRVFYIGKSSWHMKTRWYDSFALPNGKYAFANPGSNKYFELTSFAQSPKFLVMPNTHMPEVTGGAFRQVKKTSMLGLKCIVFSRNVKVRFKKTSQLQSPFGDQKLPPLTAKPSVLGARKAVYVESGTEDIWVTPDIPVHSSLLKFLSLYYNCDATTLKKMPVKYDLRFQGRPTDLERHYLKLMKIAEAPSWSSFGRLTKDSVKTDDFIQVVTGTDDSVLDFLYRGPTKKKSPR